jgi:hypothetical protein
LIAFNATLVEYLAATVINDLPGLASERAIDFKRPVEEQLPARSSSHIIVRLDVVTDLSVGDCSVANEGIRNNRLTALDDEREVAFLSHGKPVGADDELALQSARPILQTKADPGVLVLPCPRVVLHPHRPATRDLAVDRLDSRGVGLNGQRVTANGVLDCLDAG